MVTLGLWFGNALHITGRPGWPTTIVVMTSIEPSHGAVPEADRLEQETPPEADIRLGRDYPPDRPEADLLEQQIPVEEGRENPTGLDDDRVEPVEDGDWAEEADEVP